MSLPTARQAALGLGLLVVAWAALVGWHVLSARGALSDAAATVDTLQDDLTSGDVRQAADQADRLTDQLDRAQGHLDGLSVRLAGAVPVLGRNVTAVRTVTDSLARVARDGLPPVVTVASGLDASTFSPNDGRVDVDAIGQLAAPLARLDTSLENAHRTVAAIDSGGLLGPVGAKIVDAQRQVADAAQMADRGATAAKVLPTMLGADGERRYLLMFQNNAEIRTTGGLPGAFAVITAKDGAIELGTQGSGGVDLGDLLTPVAPVSDVEKQLFAGGVTTSFDDAMARDLRYTNYTPDFPRTGELAAKILKQKTGIDVDGVLSIDPVTLGYLLEATGPVTLDDGTRLDADNAVSVLLNRAYIDIPVPLQDAFFASAADKIFDRVTSGAGQPSEMVRQLTRAGQEHRLLVWSKDADVQSVLDPTPLSGRLAPRTFAPRLGTYFNDAGSGKLEYYLRYSARATSTACTDDGRQTYRETVRMTSTLPTDFASLPEYIIGNGDHVERGSMLLLAYVYAPVKGSITRIQVDGQDVEWTPLVHDKRPVAKLTITLKPGQTSTITATMRSATGQPDDTPLDVTPSVEAGTKSSVVRSSCR